MRLKRRAEQSTLWQEVRPVSPPAWQDDGREVLTCDGSGLSFSASAARLVPAGSWQRTLSESLASSLTGSTGCAVSLRVRATKCGRSLLVPTMLGRPTGGSACGLSPGSDWPTVTANESPTRFNQGGSNGRVGPKRPMLAGAVALWPTATSSIDSGFAAYSTESGRHPGTTLTDAANGLWATPNAGDYKTGASDLPSRKQKALPRDVARAGRLAPDSPSTSGKPADWPTPDVGAVTGGRSARGKSKPGRQSTEAAAKTEGQRGSLNPAWVSQLMGFPLGWLAASPPDTVARRLKASAIRSSRPVPSSSGRQSKRSKRDAAE